MKISIALDSHPDFDFALGEAISYFEEKKSKKVNEYWSAEFALRAIDVMHTEYNTNQYTYNFEVKESP